MKRSGAYRERLMADGVTLNEQRVAIRRVLRMTDRFLARQKADLLVTDGKGLMTWAEIRHHLRAAINSDLLRKPLRR